MLLDDLGRRFFDQFSKGEDQDNDVVNIADLEKRQVFEQINGEDEIKQGEITEKFQMKRDARIGEKPGKQPDEIRQMNQKRKDFCRREAVCQIEKTRKTEWIRHGDLQSQSLSKRIS